MKTLFDSAQRVLNDRFAWEAKMRKYEIMVNNGLPRLGKTGAWQADGHSKTIDRAITKLLPYDNGQMTAGDRVYNFTSLHEQLEEMTEAAADYLNFVLYNRCDFFREMRVVFSHRRLKGRGVLKATVDPLDNYKVIFEAVDPMFILMPQEANDFEDADFFVHVREFTVNAYKRLDDRYDKSEDTIKQIRGQKDFQGIGLYEQQQRLRQGINCTTNENAILVWENYQKTSGGWTVNTYSPMKPDLQLRKPYGVPYKVRGRTSIPFFSFPMESRNKGWYTPRGIAELLDFQEQFETKLQNEWADDLTLRNRPVFTGDKEIINTANIRWEAGQYIGGNIKTVQQAPPPVPYTEMLNYSRGISEEIAQTPDTGITASGSKTGGKPITAAESNRITALQQTGGNDNAMLIREDLIKVGRHVWGMLCQFKNQYQEEDFVYIAAQKIKRLPAEVLHDKYLVTVDGSPDGWNRGARVQKAVFKQQTFQGNPNVNQEKLTRQTLSAFDGNDVLELYQPTGEQQANEYAAQVININAMLAPSHGRPSFPAPVNPGEDQAVRIKADVDWLQACTLQGVPVDPRAMQAVQQDIAQRFQMLQQQNPHAAQQVKQILQQTEAQMSGGQPQGPAQLEAVA